jgi:hypothetical protein
VPLEYVHNIVLTVLYPIEKVIYTYCNAMPVILCGSESWYLKVREELRGMFVLKRKEGRKRQNDGENCRL